MKQKLFTGSYLKKTNIGFTILVILLNIINFIIADSNKDTLISLSIFINCLLFFLYRFRIKSIINKNWLSIKKEILYINYPITIGVFFAVLFVIFCADVYSLSQINKDALNATFVVAYFMSTISTLLPAILLLVYMHLLCPAFVIPAYEQRNKNKNTDILILVLFICFVLLSGYQFVTNTINRLTFNTRENFKAVKLPVQYPTKHLKYNDLSATTKEILMRDKISIPFLYTSENFTFENYDEAEKFCKSINAKVANHLEIYNIIFHRFDTHGEKYYWTRDKAGKHNLVLHFKNMSYEIIKVPKGVKPVLYCTSKINPDDKTNKKTHFVRVRTVNVEGKMNVNAKKEITFPPKNIETMKVDIKRKTANNQLEDDTIKHINFNVKHVDEEYFNKLLNKGYAYDSQVKVNSYYESNDYELEQSLIRDENMKNIRLCYYPFTEYTNTSIKNEAEIWKQSFCSPSFDVVNETPVQKTRHQKDAYCQVNGGRLANIPEIMGIIKTFNINAVGGKYWTNSNIVDEATGKETPIAIKVTEDGFVTVEPISTLEDAYTFCVKAPQKKSKIISNFRSRYKGLTGQIQAKRLCPSCTYYEMPDTVLLQ